AALDEAGFADAAAAKAVALPAAERTALAEAVRVHETALRVTAATLADPVVAAAPAEPVDTAAAQDAKTVALGVRDAAADRRADDPVGLRNTRAGLGLEVLDEHTGRARPPASLSGGETCLASLALALGLAGVVSAGAGGVRLDTLFVGEGFGSLDRETLDTAM